MPTVASEAPAPSMAYRLQGITGTDVSKAAADMILADDNFASIIAAIAGTGCSVLLSRAPCCG